MRLKRRRRGLKRRERGRQTQGLHEGRGKDRQGLQGGDGQKWQDRGAGERQKLQDTPRRALAVNQGSRGVRVEATVFKTWALGFKLSDQVADRDHVGVVFRLHQPGGAVDAVGELIHGELNLKIQVRLVVGD